jgi:hypothetical protein
MVKGMETPIQEAEPDNKGFSMLKKMGFQPGQALGKVRPSDACETAPSNPDEPKRQDAPVTTVDALKEPITVVIRQGT